MADKPAKRIIKHRETIRERAEKAGISPAKGRRLRNTASSAAKPLKAARTIGRQTYFLPMPDTSFWRFMNKPRHIIPGFIRGAFSELKLVTWPTRKETWKLTSAVFVFAIAFGIIIAATDFVLDKLFKTIILK